MGGPDYAQSSSWSWQAIWGWELQTGGLQDRKTGLSYLWDVLPLDAKENNWGRESGRGGAVLGLIKCLIRGPLHDGAQQGSG